MYSLPDMCANAHADVCIDVRAVCTRYSYRYICRRVYICAHRHVQRHVRIRLLIRKYCVRVDNTARIAKVGLFNLPLDVCWTDSLMLDTGAAMTHRCARTLCCNVVG